MSDKVVIDVNNVTIRFNLANQKVDNLKEYVIRMIKKELMFQEFLAVKNVSFQVKEGEAWGIIGTNGSGKSTLLKAVSGILKPYRGSIKINGSIAPLIELGAGFDANLTARENIYLNGAVLGHDRAFMDQHFEEIVAFSELEQFIDVPVKNFSSGMVARLGFAIATIVRAHILVVDEILAVGDFKFQQKCKAKMSELMEGGTTLHSFFTLGKLFGRESKQICFVKRKCMYKNKGSRHPVQSLLPLLYVLFYLYFISCFHLRITRKSLSEK